MTPSTEQTENTKMQLALDASVASMVSPPGAVPTDALITNHVAPPKHRRRPVAFPALRRATGRLKHAPPDLRAYGAIVVSFSTSSDPTAARQFLGAVTLLRQWGKYSIIQQPAALEAAVL